MSLAEVLVGHFTQEAAYSRLLLGAVPEDMFAWQPHVKSMSLMQLVSHIAEMPSWTHGILEGDLDLAANSDYKPYMAVGKTDLMETFDRNRGCH